MLNGERHNRDSGVSDLECFGLFDDVPLEFRDLSLV